jgi:hypothetical protein
VNARNLVVIILASTVCIVLSSSVVVALFYAPGTVTETFRLKIFEMLIYILGIISGWLMGTSKNGRQPPTNEPPKTV